jgi:hypothetical protein
VLLVVWYGLSAHGRSRKPPASVLQAEPGVMMAVEINTAQCRDCCGGAHGYRFVEMRLVKVAGLSIEQDDDPSNIAESGGEKD